MNPYTVIDITIGKVLDALGHAAFNNNIQTQVRRQAAEEVELREKYSKEAESVFKRSPVDEVKGNVRKN
jgi:hypothetical protein